MTVKSMPEISGYHAHVYYDAESKPRAERLRAAVEASFEVDLGRWHDKPIGPHPRGSYQIAFGPEQLASLLPWLMLNRDGLVVFLHALTGDHLADHRDYALWLGPSEEIDLSVLS